MSAADYYLKMLRTERNEDAFQTLIELGEANLPLLEAAYRQETDPSVRASIVEVIWRIRSASSIEFLGEALQDPAPEVWKQALDGLVTLASRNSLRTLEAAKDQAREERGEFREWIEQAIEDVSGRINE